MELRGLPIVKDVVFVWQRLKWPSPQEVGRKAWVVGILMLGIGLAGFILHTLMTLI